MTPSFPTRRSSALRRDARTSRFLAIATLNIGAETAGTQGDWLARFRIGAKLDRPGVGDAAVLSAAVLCEFAGELAFGIIGTGDERAELAAAQRKPAAAARRTRARIAAVTLVGKKRRSKQFVDRLRHRSAEHTSELQSLMRHSYAVFCL